MPFSKIICSLIWLKCSDLCGPQHSLPVAVQSAFSFFIQRDLTFFLFLFFIIFFSTVKCSFVFYGDKIRKDAFWRAADPFVSYWMLKHCFVWYFSLWLHVFHISFSWSQDGAQEIMFLQVALKISQIPSTTKREPLGEDTTRREFFEKQHFLKK